MIYFLVLIMVLITILTYQVVKGDYMAPPFILCLFFTLSELSVILMSGTWNIGISIDTVFLICFGILSFIFGYFWGSSILKMRPQNKIQIKYIYISKIFIVVHCVVSIIITVLFVYYMKNSIGGSTWNDMLAKYRFMTAYAGLTGESANIPRWINDIRFLTGALIYLFCYVLINNYIVCKKWDKSLIVAILIGVVMTLVGSSRFDLIRIPCACITMFYLLKFRQGEMSHCVRIKMLVKYIGIAVVVVLLFATLKNFVGRQSDASIVEYVAHYLGAPTLNFNDYLNNPIQSNKLTGKETFWGVYDFLYKLTGNSEYRYDYTLEFRNNNMGNVYTAFRMFYSDFGIIGVAVLSALQGAIYAFLYILVKYNIKIRIFSKRIFPVSQVSFQIILYSMMLHCVALMFYADWFYSQFISWGQIKALFFIYVFKIILIDLNTRNSNKFNCVE